MTIDEAIKHSEETARELEYSCNLWKRLADERVISLPSDYESCKKCAEEHRQLAEWLKELKRLRNRTVEEKEPPTVKIGDEVIVDGCKGIIIREPYQIGNPDDPSILVLVWYGCYMGDAQLRDVQLTGKKYPWMDVVLEELKDKKEEEE